MIDRLREMILDFQEESELRTGVPRRIAIETVPGKATVCIGVRRGGKSTFLFQIINKLKDADVPRQNILYLNFFDDRLHPLQHNRPGAILEAYFSIYPEKKNAEKIYCFFVTAQVSTHRVPLPLRSFVLGPG